MNHDATDNEDRATASPGCDDDEDETLMVSGGILRKYLS